MLIYESVMEEVGRGLFMYVYSSFVSYKYYKVPRHVLCRYITSKYDTVDGMCWVGETVPD